jgi:hypothetical protein
MMPWGPSTHMEIDGRILFYFIFKFKKLKFIYIYAPNDELPTYNQSFGQLKP